MCSQPWYCKNSTKFECKYPTYLDMDVVTRADAEQLLASFVRTLVALPDADAADARAPRQAPPAFPTMGYNERSLYMLPGTKDSTDSHRLALLLRGKHGGLSGKFTHAICRCLCFRCSLVARAAPAVVDIFTISNENALPDIV